jgi:purine-binding chemotaxis protein CheW
VSTSDQLVVFTLDEHRYALPLSAAERAVRMVEITPLPKAPAIVLGAINLAGRIVPVLNIRARFALPGRKPGVGDQLLIARTRERTVALAVDGVDGVVASSPDEVVTPPTIVPGLEYLDGVVKLADGMLFIHDLDRFLSLEEEQQLATAITHEQAPGTHDPHDR